jgi:hypothetical protein
VTLSASPEFPLVPRERALSLAGGETLTLRPVRPGDAELVEAFAAGLSDRSLYLRTFAARRHVSAEDIAKLIQVDFRRDMAFIAVHRGEDGSERIRIHGFVLRANRGMLALARRLGFLEKRIRGDMTVVSVELTLRR